MTDVLIVLGSKSDEAIAEKAADALRELGITHETQIASAHRSPDKLAQIINQTDAKVIIAIAGLSAALPGVIASKTTKPVIGVPVNVKLGGLDALLSMMQMPGGVPVATVGIDNGRNAALLAAQMLALKDEKIGRKLEDIRKGR
jgi:5-(carboxyamino)imidazole ribonucleotide mutase